jgi:hypothetical protein
MKFYNLLLKMINKKFSLGAIAHRLWFIFLFVFYLFFFLLVFFYFLKYKKDDIYFIFQNYIKYIYLNFRILEYDPLNIIYLSKKKSMEDSDFLKNINNLYVNNQGAPIFLDNFSFNFQKSLNQWNSVKILDNNNKEKIFTSYEYILKEFNEKFSYSKVTKISSYEFFLKTYFNRWMNIRDFPYFIVSDIYFPTNETFNNEILRFPRKNIRINVLNFLMKNLDVVNYYYNFNINETNNRLFNKLSINHGDLFNSIIDKKSLDNRNEKKLNSFFNYLNFRFSEHISLKYNIPNLVYYVSPLQIAHLFSLDYNQIQYILFLMQDDPYFKNKSFYDVHWELYSGNFNRVILENNISLNFSFLDFYNFIRNFFINKTSFGFFNPFELILRESYNTDILQMNKKFYFRDIDINLIPWHLILKENIGSFLNIDNFINANFYKRGFSHSFLNYFYSNTERFNESLSEYFQYGTFSKRAVLHKLLFSNNLTIKYNKSFFMINNPWWECLTIEDRIKVINVLNLNLDDNKLHLIICSAIDRFFDERQFFTFKEIENLSLLGNDKNIFDNINFDGSGFYPTLNDNKNILSKTSIYSYLDPYFIDTLYFDWHIFIKNIFLKRENTCFFYFTDSYFLRNNHIPHILKEVYIKDNILKMNEYLLRDDFGIYYTSTNKFLNIYSSLYNEFFQTIYFKKHYSTFYSSMVVDLSINYKNISDLVNIDDFFKNLILNYQKKNNFYINESYFLSEKELLKICFLYNIIIL